MLLMVFLIILLIVVKVDIFHHLFLFRISLQFLLNMAFICIGFISSFLLFQLSKSHNDEKIITTDSLLQSGFPVICYLMCYNLIIQVSGM